MNKPTNKCASLANMDLHEGKKYLGMKSGKYIKHTSHKADRAQGKHIILEALA